MVNIRINIKIIKYFSKKTEKKFIWIKLVIKLLLSLE